MSKKPQSKASSKLPSKVVLPKPLVSKQVAAVPSKLDQAEAAPPVLQPLPKEIDLKTAVKLVFDHADPDLENSNKWPLLIDVAERCGAFFRHRDTRYVQCFQKADLEIESLRLKILSSYFYGTTLVIDLIDNSQLLGLFIDACNEISANLFEDLCNKTIVANKQRYKDLIKESDGDEYAEWKIRNQHGGFGVCFLTTNKEIAKLMPFALPFIVEC